MNTHDLADDILRSYEVKWLVCARNWTLIQSLRQAGKYDYFPQANYFGQLIGSVHWFM